MDGLMMDFPLTLTHLLRRAEQFFPDARDRHADARQELPPHDLRRDDAPLTPARGRAQEGRARARRSRRDALLESLPAPRGVLRRPVRRLRPPHAQPPPPPERARVHRHARERQGRHRRPPLLPLLETVPRGDADRARLRRRGLVRGAARDRRPRRVGRPGSSTRTRRRRCASRPERPVDRAASSTAPLVVSCTRSASARTTRSAWASASATPCCRSCRCSTRTRGATRISPSMQGAKLVFPGPHLDADVAARADMEQEKVTWAAGVPTIWIGILARLDEEPEQVGSLRDEGDARRRLGRATGDDRRRSSRGTG